MAQDNLAQDNLAQDNLAQDNLAQDNLAQDNLAQDNLAQDNLAQDNLAQDNLAQDNLAQDNLAQDNLAQDNLAQDAKLAQDQVNVAKDANVAQGQWPPHAVKTIVAEETAAVPSTGITIQDACDTKTGTACNVLMQGGTLTNAADIIVEGTRDDTSIVVESGNNTFTNGGTVTVATGATAVQVKTGASLSIGGSGTINEADSATNTTGVSIATEGSLTNTGNIGNDETLSTGVSLTGGTLTNSGTIGGTTAAVKITGSDPATTTFETNSVVTGFGGSPVAIDASDSTGKVTVNIEGGTFTGDIKGQTGTGSELNIKATSAEGIKNNISGFENINIKGAGWTAQGWVSGATTVNASSAIADLYVSGTEPSTRVETVGVTNTLHLATGAVADAPAKTLNINSPMPPAEKTAKPVQINPAEPGLIGTLTVGADAQFGAVTNVDDIVITADNWQSTGVITNPKAITVGVASTEEASEDIPSGKVTAINYVASAAKSGSTSPGSLDVTFNQ